MFLGTDDLIYTLQKSQYRLQLGLGKASYCMHAWCMVKNWTHQWFGCDTLLNFNIAPCNIAL